MNHGEATPPEVEYADDFADETVEVGTFPAHITMPIGQPPNWVPCRRSDGLGLSTVTIDNDVTVGALVLTTVADDVEVGIVSPLPPAELRALAASMLSVADEIDGGSGLQ